MSDERTVPALKVVRGNPTAEELAALIVVLTARSAGSDTGEKVQRSAWASYWNSHRPPLAPGAGAWRASALPR